MIPQNPKPAYREPWFWLVMAPLMLVVVVCSVLLSVAFRGADDRVIDNYYKQGRLINNRFEAEKNAMAMGIRGALRVDLAKGRVLVDLAGQNLPDSFLVTFSHPADSALDKTLSLQQTDVGRYQADLLYDLHGRWYVILTDDHSQPGEPWRVTAEANFSQTQTVPIAAHL